MERAIAYAIDHRAVTYLVVAILFFGGIAAFTQLGQLEDPEFTVKTAVVTTLYPGATAAEVELEVTDRLEKAIQEIPELDDIYSISRPGVSIISLDIEQQYWADELPQIWDVLRAKIRDAERDLPPGVQRPLVSDDFNFVYGFVIAITGDGFTYRQIEDYSDLLRKELAVIPGVARVETWGYQTKTVYVDISETQLVSRGLTAEDVAATLQIQNAVVDAGSIDLQDMRFRVAPTGEFTRPEQIAELAISPRGAPPEILNTRTIPIYRHFPTPRVDDIASNEIVRIGDVATVRAGYLEPPLQIMRFNGLPAYGLSIAGRSGTNIVDVGARLEARVNELTEELPVGIEIHKVAWQSDLVDESIRGFMVNLVMAVGIVLVVLIVPSGLRMGLIIGSNLLITITGTFIFMVITETDLQRMSLGALVIAMGMMVDNSIVISDSIGVAIRRGMERRQAAIQAASKPSFPLFSATLVAIMAFYPIYASEADAGEYCFTLFTVVAASLTISWLVAMFVTPVQCIDLLPEPEPGKAGAEGGDEYSKGLFVAFRRLVEAAIRVRWITIGILGGLLVVSAYGFGFVKQMFFPDSARPQLMLDYWAPQGTRIQQVSSNLRKIEDHLLADERVSDFGSFIGGGPPRFYLPVDPEMPYPEYAQLVLNFDDFREIDPFIEDLEDWVPDNVPEALVRVRKFGVGPSNTWPFEARISGPAIADLGTLREYAGKYMDVIRPSPYARDLRIDMRQRLERIEPYYDQERGRWSDVSRRDVANATRRAFDGLAVGLYREKEDLWPIILRHSPEERQTALGNLELLQVQPAQTALTVPLSQVTRDIAAKWEDPIIVRYNRRRAVTVQASPDNATFPTLQANVIDDLEAIELPSKFELFWDGEAEDTRKAQASLIPGMIPAAVVIVFLIVAVFNAFRPLLIILITMPFALIGITASLLLLDTPFGFLALLGAMSLAGMMNKNIVVLLDAVNDNLANGMKPYEAVVYGAVTRMRPVLLAAGTTALGVIPLLPDVFWTAMAVTIMGGLVVGSVLTLVVVPVLYTIFYGIPATGDAPETLGSGTPQPAE